MTDATAPALPSAQTFSSDYFVSTGIYVLFTPAGSSSTNVLSGWKLKDITRGDVTVTQEEVSHQLGDGTFKEFVGLDSDGGDLTVSAYFEPKKAQPSPGDLKTLKGGHDGVLELIFVEYASGSTTGTAYRFFVSKANVQSYGGFSAPLGKPATCNFKFKITGEPLYGADAQSWTSF